MRRNWHHFVFAAFTLAIATLVWLWTDSHRSIAAYEKQAQHLLIHSDTAAVVFLDLDGTIVAISPAARDMLGWHDAIGRNAGDLMPGQAGQGHSEALAESSMTAGEARIIECSIATEYGPQPIVLLVQKYNVGSRPMYAAHLWYVDDFDARGLRR